MEEAAGKDPCRSEVKVLNLETEEEGRIEGNEMKAWSKPFHDLCTMSPEGGKDMREKDSSRKA